MLSLLREDYAYFHQQENPFLDSVAEDIERATRNIGEFVMFVAANAATDDMVSLTSTVTDRLFRACMAVMYPISLGQESEMFAHELCTFGKIFSTIVLSVPRGDIANSGYFEAAALLGLPKQDTEGQRHHRLMAGIRKMSGAGPKDNYGYMSTTLLTAVHVLSIHSDGPVNSEKIVDMLVRRCSIISTDTCEDIARKIGTQIKLAQQRPAYYGYYT
jgi:hypothetical protein